MFSVKNKDFACFVSPFKKPFFSNLSKPQQMFLRKIKQIAISRKKRPILVGSLRSALFSVLERLSLIYNFFCWIRILDRIRTVNGEKKANNENLGFSLLISGTWNFPTAKYFEFFTFTVWPGRSEKFHISSICIHTLTKWSSIPTIILPQCTQCWRRAKWGAEAYIKLPKIQGRLNLILFF